MPERTGQRLPRLTRRRMLEITASTATLAGLAISPLGSVIRGDILALARLKLVGTPLEILFPANNFASCQAYQNICTYTESSYASNLVVGFGDSNLYGTHERFPSKKPTTPLTFLEDLVRDRSGANWETKNYAIPGYRTEQILKDQVLRDGIIKTVQGFAGTFDVWINAGGNDFRTVMDAPARAASVEKLSNQPVSAEVIRNIPMFKDIAHELLQVLQSFGPAFYDLLSTIADRYGQTIPDIFPAGRLQHIVVITAPDSSKTDRVDSSMIEGNVYRYNMQNPLARAISRLISIHLNDQMAAAMNQFMEEHPSMPLVAINTFDLDRDSFDGDIHYNDKGKQIIAKRFLERVVIV